MGHLDGYDVLAKPASNLKSKDGIKEKKLILIKKLN